MFEIVHMRLYMLYWSLEHSLSERQVFPSALFVTLLLAGKDRW
jgi:hypothetical protein